MRREAAVIHEALGGGWVSEAGRAQLHPVTQTWREGLGENSRVARSLWTPLLQRNLRLVVIQLFMLERVREIAQCRGLGTEGHRDR